ncbi:transposase, partial [Corallococcus interemptor]
DGAVTRATGRQRAPCASTPHRKHRSRSASAEPFHATSTLTLTAFVSRRGDRVKVLTWSRGGFVLLYKRLEAGRFRLPPVDAGAQAVTLDATQLAMLLDGIDVAQVRRQPAWTPPGRTGS